MTRPIPLGHPLHPMMLARGGIMLHTTPGAPRVMAHFTLDDEGTLTDNTTGRKTTMSDDTTPTPEPIETESGSLRLGEDGDAVAGGMWHLPKPTEKERTLDADQRARVKALKAAKEVLTTRNASRGPLTSGGEREVDTTDLHSLAVYIVTGRDPWALDDGKDALIAEHETTINALRNRIENLDRARHAERDRADRAEAREANGDNS